MKKLKSGGLHVVVCEVLKLSVYGVWHLVGITMAEGTSSLILPPNSPNSDSTEALGNGTSNTI
jgi:hypothetical protein